MSKIIPALLNSNDMHLQLQGIRLALNTRSYFLLPHLIKLSCSEIVQVAEAANNTAMDLAEICLLETEQQIPETVLHTAVDLVKKLNPAFIANLNKQLETGSDEEVKKALLVIKHFITEKKAEDLLRKLSKHQDPSIRATAVLHLGNLAARINTDILSRYLEDDNHRVRANTIEILGNLENKFYIRILKRYRNDPHHRVRANTLLSLYKLGELDIKDDFQMMLFDTNSSLRSSAVWAIGEIGQTAPYFLRLLDSIKNDTSEMVKAQLLVVLKKLGQLPELEFLRESLKEELKLQLKNSIVHKKNLNITQNSTEYYLKLSLSGILTAQTVLAIKLLLDELISKENRFVLDITDIEYIDSSGVGLLVNFNKIVKKKHGFMYLYGCNERILELFSLSKVDTILDIFKTIDEVQDFLVLPAK